MSLDIAKCLLGVILSKLRTTDLEARDWKILLIGLLLAQEKRLPNNTKKVGIRIPPPNMLQRNLTKGWSISICKAQPNSKAWKSFLMLFIQIWTHNQGSQDSWGKPLRWKPLEHPNRKDNLGDKKVGRNKL